jgi:acyl carrier protein
MDRMGPLPGGEPQLALRGGRAYAPRLARAGAPDGRSALQGTVLVTGAGEPAGAGVARRLASHAGIERLLLVDAPDALVAELGPRAVAIRARELDTALVHEPELHAVIHTTVDARLAERLDGRTAGRELDAFLCFASATATLGAGGDPRLAGASAALEALAVRRRERGLPAQVLAWERLPRSGDAWLDLFERALRHGAPYLIVARENLAALPDSPLLAGVKPGATRSFARRVAALPEAERPALVLGLVREHTAAVLAHSDPDAIEPDRRFKDLGMDSITAVALRNRLVQATGVALPTTLIFDHPSCAAVTRVLLRTLVPESDPVAAPADDERVTAIDAMDVDDLIRMTYAMES